MEVAETANADSLSERRQRRRRRLNETCCCLEPRVAAPDVQARETNAGYDLVAPIAAIHRINVSFQPQHVYTDSRRDAAPQPPLSKHTLEFTRSTHSSA